MTLELLLDDIYENIKEYSHYKKCKVLIVFDDNIADMLSNNKLNPIVTKLFIRDWKLNIYLVFITPSYFAVPKNYTQNKNSTHYFIVTIPNRQELQKLHLIMNHTLIRKTSWIFTNNVLQIYVLATFASDNPLFQKQCFRKNTKN